MEVSLPKGTRDFLPEQALKRKYIFDSIEAVFQRYGYAPIETPAFENLSTLTGKYGEEGDALLFKVLNNGDFLEKVDAGLLASKNSQKLVNHIAKRGLRYDLTVPFARFVVMHQHEVHFPFKRYQIQPVWRADRPQKGRYQEFFQCDADVIGSDALMYEAELILIYDQIFTALGLPVDIKINHRKILLGIAEAAGIADRFTDMTVAIDKLDKVGVTGVLKEMVMRGIPEGNASMVLELTAATEAQLHEALVLSPTGLTGLQELATVRTYLAGQSLKNSLSLDLTLARGLNYYTGCILEVKAQHVQMGSLGGGGRYADLTGAFGLKNLSGVGISLGAERIFDVMEDQQLFPAGLTRRVEVIFIAFDAHTHLFAFDWVQKVRAAGLAADIYPTPEKFKKQMKYADDIAAPYVAIVGPDEMLAGEVTLKNMHSGDQKRVNLTQLLSIISQTDAK